MALKIKSTLRRLVQPRPDQEPDFIVAGATRSGTTFLHHVLSTRPDIFMPTLRKELSYFNHDGRYTPALDGYRDLFAGYGRERLIGEATPLYWENGAGCDADGVFSTFRGTDTMARIRKALPGVRIVLSLRDPVRRLFSIYKKNWYQDKFTRPLQEYLSEELSRDAPGELLTRMRYADNLAHTLDLFGREAVHVMIFERWTGDDGAGINAMLRFLGAAPLSGAAELAWLSRNTATRYAGNRTGRPPVALDAATHAALDALADRDRRECEAILGTELPWGQACGARATG